MENNIKSELWIKKETTMMVTLLRSVPVVITLSFIISVIVMNLLAQITIVSLPWLALNAGVFVSWLSFLSMDIITKHFGAKAATKVSIMAMFANLLSAVICLIISLIGTIPSLDMFLGGAWSILLASTIAFLLSAVVNNFLNAAIGKRFKKNPDSKVAYVTRTYISTFVGQFVDNFAFIALAFILFPNIPGAAQVHWTVYQGLGCAVICAFIELGFEIVFSPLGYRITRKMKKDHIGYEYIDKYCTEEEKALNNETI